MLTIATGTVGEKMDVSKRSMEKIKIVKRASVRITQTHKLYKVFTEDGGFTLDWLFHN